MLKRGPVAVWHLRYDDMKDDVFKNPLVLSKIQLLLAQSEKADISIEKTSEPFLSRIHLLYLATGQVSKLE